MTWFRNEIRNLIIFGDDDKKNKFSLDANDVVLQHD